MTKLKNLRPLLLNTSRQFHNCKLMSTSTGNSNGSDSDSKAKKFNRPMFVPDTPLTVDDIQEPTNCCMSGCANCVWIQYAEKLSTVLKDSKGDVQKLIMDKVQDPNMRAFLLMELRTCNLVD